MAGKAKRISRKIGKSRKSGRIGRKRKRLSRKGRSIGMKKVSLSTKTKKIGRNKQKSLQERMGKAED